MKKVVFIGAGASTLFSSILLKRREPSYDIYIVEKDKKLGRKLSMTGGGKCNIAPVKDDIDAYNLDSNKLIKDLFNSISFDEYLSLLKEAGVPTKTIKDYGYYPLHESAPQVVKNLFHQINKLGIKIINDEFVSFSIEKKQINIELKKEKIVADNLVLATGGLSKEMKEMLSFKGIKVTNTLPGLCPLKVKENVSSLFGSRFEANIALLYKDKIVKECYGEIQFKKDGLSGIPVLNYSSYIARQLIEGKSKLDDYQISIGQSKELIPEFSKKLVGEVLFSIFREEYVAYLIDKHHLDKFAKVDEKIISIIMGEKFSISDLYNYASAQVIVGGITLDDIDSNFELKNFKGVYAVGELLNVDGICGGYNLRFAITSAIKAIRNI